MKPMPSVLSAQGRDHLSSLAVFGSDSGSRKLQRQKVNLLQQQQRRKWSDWSECSSNCVKTRHRLNCDDIVGQQAQNASAPVLATTNRILTATTRPSISAISVQEKLVITTPSSSSKDEENLLLKVDQIDEEDYDDEEEDETDPCANVDTARTFEEKPCTGGLCRLGHIQRSPPHQSQAHTVKGSLLEPGLVDGGEALLLKQAELSSTRQRTNALNSRLPVKPAAQIDKFNQAQLQTNATASAPPVWQAAPNATRSIWPLSQLSALGEPSLQAGLIQWAILLGSLLVIVLLIMLIARKLFFSAFQPSYHWMLAKHTIKSSSKLNALNGDCCYAAGRPPQAPGAGASLVVGASTHQAPTFASNHLGCSTASVLLADGQPSLPPHHMCYAWRRNTSSSSNSQAANNKSCSNGQTFQCIVDAQGRHLLDTAQNPFNTSTNTPMFNANQSCHSNSSSYTTMKTARRFYAGSYDDLCERNSVISNMNNYNYDTLNSNNQSQQQPKGENCFVLTRDFVVGRQAAAKQCAAPHRKSSVSNEETGQDARFLESRNQLSGVDLLEPSRPRTKSKHRSPNVPERFEGCLVDEQDGEVGTARVYDLPPPCERRQQQSGSSSISVASEPESVEELSGSHSGQSTTAPMLSQAASSSFEQAPDLPTIECSTPLSCKQLQSALVAHSQTSSTPNSSAASPAFHSGGHKFRHHQRKNSISRASELARNFNPTVQSQPNSPMLVSQCTSRDKNLFKRNGQSGHTKVAAIARRFQEERPKESSSLKDQEAASGTEQHYPMDALPASRRSGGASEIGGSSNFQMMSDVHRADTNDDRHFYEEIDGKT